jgi:glutamate racemase
MNKTRLAMIDWGIGGIGILKLIKQEIGNIPVTYFSDTGVTPYGKMNNPELVRRLNDVLAYLKAEGATHVVIGCNSASTALPAINDQDLKIAGMIECGVAAALRQKPKRLGLIGGRRTVMSHRYQTAFKAHGIGVKQRVAQPLSGMIESGDISSPALAAECKRVLTPLRNCSHILLACTHYPAILPLLQECVSDKTVFVDPAEEIITTVSKWKLDMSSGSDLYITTGDPENMKISANAAFGWDVSEAHRVRI